MRLGTAVRVFGLVVLLLCGTTSHAQSLNLNNEYQRIQSTLEKNPNDLKLKMDLAYLFSQGSEYERAIAIYADVLNQDPKNLRAATELCALETETHDHDKAITACETAAELDPKNLLMHDNLGLSHFKFGEFRLALKSFLAALRLQPDAILVRTHIAQTFLAMGELKSAQGYFANLSREKGGSPEDRTLIYYGLYLADRGLKDYDHAFTAIWETYKLSGNPLFWGRIVSTYMLKHQIVFFFLIGVTLLVAANYFGERLNQFLKNEN